MLELVEQTSLLTLKPNYVQGIFNKCLSFITWVCKIGCWFSFSGFFWIFLDLSGFFWIFLDLSGFFWIFLDFSGLFLIFLDFSGFFWIFMDFSGFFWIFLDSGFWILDSGFFCIHPDFTVNKGQKGFNKFSFCRKKKFFSSDLNEKFKKVFQKFLNAFLGDLLPVVSNLFSSLTLRATNWHHDNQKNDTRLNGIRQNLLCLKTAYKIPVIECRTFIVMLIVVMLIVVMLIVVMLKVVMLKVVMLIVVMLIVVMLIVVMLIVAKPTVVLLCRVTFC
jgi:hypothetical protein